MKVKSMLCACAVITSFLMGNALAYAEEITAEPKFEMHDNICGKVCVTPDAGSDTYIQIYKNTLESPEGGYLLYDSVIKADTVKEGDVYVFPLECTSYNDEAMTYESSYLIKIGVPKYKTSSEPVYYTQTVFVDDTEFLTTPTEYSDIYVYNLSLTDELLSSPVKEVVSSDITTYVCNLTFSSLNYLPGDANLDGQLNIRDAALIARKLAERKVSELPDGADYNGDGTVNIRDAAAIARSLTKK